AGRLASWTCRSPERVGLVRGIAAGVMMLGFVFYGVDVRDAVAEKEAAESAAIFIRQEDSAARIWYVGHWGFQYYAERAGMMPVVPDDSRLAAGDWLVMPDGDIEQQRIRLDGEPLAK